MTEGNRLRLSHKMSLIINRKKMLKNQQMPLTNQRMRNLWWKMRMAKRVMMIIRNEQSPLSFDFNISKSIIY